MGNFSLFFFWRTGRLLLDLHINIYDLHKQLRSCYAHQNKRANDKPYNETQIEQFSWLLFLRWNFDTAGKFRACTKLSLGLLKY